MERRGLPGRVATVLVFLAVLAAVAVLPPRARADTYVSGPISTDTTWTFAGSPYIVIGNVTVEAGANLTIEEGVEVRVDPGLEIAVFGRLLAVGSGGNGTILFTANASAMPVVPWHGIRAAGGRVQVENATLEHAEEALHVGYSPMGSTELSVLRNSLLRYNTLAVSGQNSALAIESNTFLDNTKGVYLSYPVAGGVDGNTFDGNTEYGITVLGTQTSLPTLGITGNSITGSAVGIDVSNLWRPDFLITGNEVFGNSQFGLRITEAFGVIVEGNTFTDNGLGVMDGAGLYVVSVSGMNAPVRVRCNEFSLNAHGARLVATSGVLTHLNAFLDNTFQASDDGNGSNAWDNGSVGNHWSDYGGTDGNSDGIGDTPYTVDVGVLDGFPLMAPPVTDPTSCPPPGTALPPVAVPGGPYNGGKNRPLGFDGSASYDPDGTVVSYAWDFGDGNVGGGATPTHTYTAGGTFTVTLTVTDDDGLTDTATTTATIDDLPPLPPTMAAARLAGGAHQHLELEWQLSADDGGLDNDVVAYDIHSGAAYDPTGASYTLLTSVPAGTTTHLVTNGGLGQNEFYLVYARENTGRITAAADQAGVFSRFLTAGKQLVSVPLEQEDWSVGEVLQTLSWSKARTYANLAGHGHNWHSNQNQKPWQDLQTLDRKMAVWVQVDADGFWTVAGLVPHVTEITLKVGWNFLGFPSFAPQTVAQLLAGINYQTVEGYADDPPYYLERLSPSDSLSAGNGYWVHISGSDATLTFTN